MIDRLKLNNVSETMGKAIIVEVLVKKKTLPIYLHIYF